MNDTILSTITLAGPLAALIVAAIAAVQKRVAALDGWFVLVVAAVLAVGMTGLFLPLAGAPALLAAGRVAFVAWLLAVGGDAWAAKIASKAASQPTVVAPDPEGSTEHVTITRKP